MRKQKQTTSHYLWRAFGFPALVITAIAVLSLVRAGPARAAPGTNQQLNYQARLLSSQGAVVPDGLYNIEFKIYQDGNGVLGGGDETLEWTETRSGVNKVTVKNGYFSVYLGSVTPFGSSVDWNQDTLWLSVNIGGTGASPSFDGEMSPFTRLSSTPYAINSRQLGGLTSTQFVQLAQGAQTDSSANASLHINDTAGGNLLHLLSGGTDRFIVSNTGTLTAATALDTINGIIINNGAISGVAGFTQSSGDFNASASTGTFDTSTGEVSLNGNTTVTGVATFTVTGGLTTLGNGLEVSAGGFDVTGNSTLDGTLSGLTGMSSSGTITLDSFGSTAGILDVDAAGVVSLATAGTDYEVPLTFGNGLTRSSNAVSLGGTLTADTTLNLDVNNLIISGSGHLAVGGDTTPNSLFSVGSTSQFQVNSSGAIAAITGYTQTSGNFDASTSSGSFDTTTGTVQLNGNTTVTGSKTFTVAGGLTTLSGGITVTGAASMSGGAVNINVNSNNNVNINTGTSTGTTTIGNTLSTLIINSTAFMVTSGGAVSGLTTLDASGNINTSSGGFSTNSVLRLTNTGALQNITGLSLSGTSTLTGATTLSGGAVNINVNSNNNVNINTGTSTGTTTIGGGSSPLVINSTNFDVSSAGAVSGVTTLNSSSTIASATGFAVNGNSGLTLDCGNQNVRGGFIGGLSTTVTCGGLSDQRVKINIVSLDDNIIRRIKNINTVNFDFDCNLEYFEGNYCDTDRQTGVIAQQLAKVFPELVYEETDGYFRVKYDALNIYTLKAVTQMATAYHNDNRPIFSNSSALQDYTFAQAALPADEWLEQLEAVNTGVQSEIVSDRVSAVSELVAPEVITNQLRTSIITTGPNGLQINLSSNDGKFALVGADGEALFEVDAEGNAYFAGDIQADNTDVLGAVDTKLQALLNTGIVAGGSSEFYGLLNIHALTNFFDEVVFADNVTFQSIVMFNNDNGGFATIKEGDSEVRIEFEQPFPAAPVVNISNSGGKFVSYSYGDLDETGFTIFLKEPALEDINFSWTAFAIDSPRTEVSISKPEE